MLTSPWLPRWRLRHSVLLTMAGAVGAVAGFVLAAPSLGAQIAVVSILVATLALPHGAIDPWVGSRWFAEHFGGLGMWVFGAGYVGLATVVVGLWAVVPAISLAIFLAVAALHFGLEDHEAGLLPRALAPVEIFARGALPVVACLAFRPDETKALFAMLVGPVQEGTLAGWVTASRDGLVTMWIAALGLALYGHGLGFARRHDARHAAAFAEIVALVAAFAFLPPLLAFALYFCLGHSLRHTLGIAAKLDPRSPGGALRRFVLAALPLSLVASGVAVSGWIVLANSSAPIDAGVRVVFVGLAALTAPHLVIAVLARRSGPQDVMAAPPQPLDRLFLPSR